MKKNGEFRSVGGVLLILLLGKCLSLAANQAYLSFFGAENERLNIFSWALQIPGYLFQSAGTALVSVVIPVYASLRATGREREAGRFASNLLSVCTLFAALVCAAGLCLSAVLPELTEFGEKAYASFCLRLVMPAVICYCLTYILQGLLQTAGRHAAAAAVNLPGGVLILLYLAFFARRYGVTGLLVTVVFGLFLQVVMLAVPARRAGFRYRPTLDLRDGTLRAAGRNCLPVLFGASAYQLSLLCNHTILSNVAPAWLSMFHLIQTILISLVTVVTTAVNSVAYPTLTALAARGETEEYRRFLRGKMNLLIFLLVPLTLGLAVLGLPALRLLSLHGKMTQRDILTEYGFLLSGAGCIVFLGLKELADRALYALHTTKLSAAANALILLADLPLCWFLSRFTALGAFGIPLGYSLSVAAGTLFLLWRLRKKLGGYGGGIAETLGKTLLSGAVMAGAAGGGFALLSGPLSDTFLGQLCAVALSALLGAAVFLLVSRALKAPPVMELLRRKKA